MRISIIKKDPVLRERFIKMVECGANNRELMDEFLIAPSTLINWKKCLGLPVSAFRLDREPKTRERFCHMVESGATYGEISEALGVDKKTVFNWKKRMGFPMKPCHVGDWKGL